MPCDNSRGWDRVSGRREVQEGENISNYMICVVVQQKLKLIILCMNFSPLKNKFKKQSNNSD